MGYGSINGFRASVATPFFWYDLKNEEATNLLVHPFCFMDANSYYEQKQSAEESMQELWRYYQTIQSVKGQMITIWHNSFLGTAPEFEGWREAYQQFVATIAEGAN
jgi:exo-beta-1,3-glucanase (GH17 family)